MRRNVFDTHTLDLLKQRNERLLGQEPAVKGHPQCDPAIAKRRFRRKVLETLHGPWRDEAGVDRKRGPRFNSDVETVAIDRSQPGCNCSCYGGFGCDIVEGSERCL